MLRFLFPRLTPAPERGEALFAALTAKARETHWYLEGGVPDTLDGRFRMLTTLMALTIVKLEQDGDAGDSVSVALTERFIAVMESEHRELGLGDPKLGRTVRKLVTALARRVGDWRQAVSGGDWKRAARASLYDADVDEVKLDHAAAALRKFWSGLDTTMIEDLCEGRLQ